MTKQTVKNTFGWGIVLWFIGYVLGIVLFMVVPSSFIGWVITPIGVAITVWVLTKKIQSQKFLHYATLAAVWTVIAIMFDYIFLVQLFTPTDGYYKLDVYLYYLLTFILPIIIGWKKTAK